MKKHYLFLLGLVCSGNTEVEETHLNTRYALEEIPVIEAKNSEGVAYYFFDKHYLMYGETNPDPHALDCHVEVYKKLEELYKNKKIIAVWGEGTYKGKFQLDVIKEQVHNYSQSLPAQFEGSQTQFTEAEIREFVNYTEDAKNALAINYAGALPVRGWENTPDAELSAEHRAFFEKSKRLGDKQFEADLKANVERRSHDAYVIPLELGVSNYAVIVGKRHRQDILTILAGQQTHPQIVSYICP